MNPGTMNRRVDVLKLTEFGRDDLNVPTPTWQPTKTIWAAMVAVRAEERHSASEKFATRAVTFRTYFFDLAETDRLRCEGRVYEITGIAELGVREGLEISAEWLEGRS